MKSAFLINAFLAASTAQAMRLAKPSKLETVLTMLPEEYIVEKVNGNPEATWQAESRGVFDSNSIEDVIGALGTEVYEQSPFVEEGENSVSFTDEQYAAIPESFDAREKWPNCIHPIRNQEKCGSCWAFGSTEALSDRFCIAGKDVVLSPEWLVQCDWFDMGCSGGRLMSAWEYLHFKGVPSDECVPYTSIDGTAGSCPKKCVDGTDIQMYKANKVYSLVSFWDTQDKRVKNMQAEIYYNGPIEAAFMVYQDFYTYKTGVYKHLEGPFMGGHAIKVVGWGTDEKTKTPYWIVANSWSAGWGENGYFKIARGSNECNLEHNAWAGIPQL